MLTKHRQLGRYREASHRQNSAVAVNHDYAWFILVSFLAIRYDSDATHMITSDMRRWIAVDIETPNPVPTAR